MADDNNKFDVPPEVQKEFEKWLDEYDAQFRAALLEFLKSQQSSYIVPRDLEQP